MPQARDSGRQAERGYNYDTRSNASAVEQRGQNFLCFENFAGDRASSASVAFIIGIDYFHCIDNFVQRLKGEQSGVAAVVFCESSFLSDHRPASGEITTGAITELTGV